MFDARLTMLMLDCACLEHPRGAFRVLIANITRCSSGSSSSCTCERRPASSVNFSLTSVTCIILSISIIIMISSSSDGSNHLATARCSANCGVREEWGLRWRVWGYNQWCDRKNIQHHEQSETCYLMAELALTDSTAATNMSATGSKAASSSSSNAFCLWHSPRLWRWKSPPAKCDA
jgi:hypothetical protein